VAILAPTVPLKLYKATSIDRFALLIFCIRISVKFEFAFALTPEETEVFTVLLK